MSSNGFFSTNRIAAWTAVLFFTLLMIAILINWNNPDDLSDIHHLRRALLSLISEDSQSARYLLSAIIQSVATILTLIFTISLIILQLLYRQPRITRLFITSKEMKFLLIYSFSTIVVSVFALSSIRGPSLLDTIDYLLFLASIGLFISIPIPIWIYWIFCADFLNPETLMDIVMKKETGVSQQLEAISAIMDKALEEGNMKAIEKGCAQTRVIFELAYDGNSFSTQELILKNLGDLARKSIKYGPETLEPFLSLFSSLMEFDAQKKTAYPHLRRTFNSTVFGILKGSLDEGNIEAIERGCAYTKDVFKQAYSDYSSSDVEFLFMNLRDMAKKSTMYDVETLGPLAKLFVELMVSDSEKNTTHSYIRNIYESAEPIVRKIIQSDQKDVIENYFDQLSRLQDSITDHQNFDAAFTYVGILRRNFQEIIRNEMRDRNEFMAHILFMIRDVFSNFTRFRGEEIQKKDGRRQETLAKMINEYCNIGYLLIGSGETHFFGEYLDSLEYMYLRLLLDIELEYYPTKAPYQIEEYERSENIRRSLKYEFFLLLFRLGVLSLTKNGPQFVARILSREKTDRNTSLVNYTIYEDFLKNYRAEEYLGWALGNPFRVLGSTGNFSCETEIIQFYLLIRSKTLFTQMKISVPETQNYSGARLKKFLRRNSAWIFFEKKIPKEFSSRDKKVSFMSNFMKEFKSFNSGGTQATGCSDFPDYMRTIKIFGRTRAQFDNVIENFPNEEIISQEVFSGALKQFLKITKRLLNKINKAWEEERRRIERSFPIKEERKEKAIKMISDALKREGIFRRAVEWKKCDQSALENTKLVSSELFLELVKIDSNVLKDLPIIASFDTLGEMTAHKEDKGILDTISEKITRKMSISLRMNVETIRKFQEELECDTIILITDSNIEKDLWDSGEIQYLRSFDRAYEVGVSKERKALVYHSNLLKDEVLIFAKDRFFEILYFQEEDIRFRSPKEGELQKEEIKEDFQVVEISQKKWLKFLDPDKAVIIRRTKSTD